MCIKVVPWKLRNKIITVMEMILMKKNVLVAQSGGPTPVINASLQGVIERCLSYNDHVENVYASWHGIEGVLLENLVDISSQPMEEIRLLRHTPSAGSIGTCRYKLGKDQEEDFARILDVIKAHNIGYFFYIGGNDSMDTASKVSKLAGENGLELVVTGVPKTIDNDIGDANFTIIDHTPGYGSVARYWSYIIQNTNEESRAMSGSEPVMVLQAMGRKSGFITAASRLADPEREMPLQLYMAETNHNLETLAENVNMELKRSGRCIVVVNEGFNVGRLGEVYDAFGHIEYGASRTTTAQVVVNYLNEKGLAVRGQATVQVPGMFQRSTSIYASKVDQDEAYRLGEKAVEIAMHEGTGWMATILRAHENTYRALYDKVKLEKVANSERFLPSEWITKDGIDVTDDFINYAMPLIGDGWPDIIIDNGLQRFTRFDIKYIDKLLTDYVPVKFRTV